MARFIATVASGLEEVAVEEIVAFGLPAVQSSWGAVTFDGPAFPSPQGVALLRELNRWARSVDRVGVLLGDGDAEDLDACYELAVVIDYAPLIHPAQSFAVRAARRGDQDFGSVDVARIVGQAIIDSVGAARAGRLRVSLRHPDVILRVQIDGVRFRIWLDATGDEPLYRRDYRAQLHPASLRATLAYSMLRLARWEGEPLLDPMTGIGTIPIEAGLRAHGVDPGRFRRTPLAVDTMFRRSSIDAAARPTAEPTRIVLPGPLARAGGAIDVLGMERYGKHLQGALRNLAAAGPIPGVRFRLGDARHLESHVKAGRYRLAVVNPPFGRKVGSAALVGALYSRFAASAARTGIETIVALAESQKLMCDALAPAGFEIVRSLAVMYGRLPAGVIVARRGG